MTIEKTHPTLSYPLRANNCTYARFSSLKKLSNVIPDPNMLQTALKKLDANDTGLISIQKEFILNLDASKLYLDVKVNTPKMT